MKSPRQNLFALSFLALSAGFAGPAAASEGLAIRLASEVSQVIAAQGNMAFQQIRADVKHDLTRRIDAWLTDVSDRSPAPAAELQNANGGSGAQQ